ncbi:anhydro-N-acetylmuramic acid kinase [Vibrio sp. SS-MA-C1-2]|uniref:anhydro-N-acetylmuramic acid kinase n=1 Tax=Vibrio sp. SS-MA-C1-2 TaxID=2908646 RepID=UPI001F45C6B3|nr:anhydro-N-acetylmuramic acid kinase [Vibrio sp. SS-MA-C1-2]UJF17967.1 anhydro-N-acetylmuramic acid kinase [Vibrio sp. SS-MA-C1-2]
MDKQLYIGIMSGTSMDGVDCVLTEISDQKPDKEVEKNSAQITDSVENEQIRLIANLDYPMPDALKEQLLAICTGQPTDLPTIGKIDHLLGQLYADAIHALLKHSGYQAADITAIGNHGQTVFHQPTGQTPFTIQLGDANIIAAQTGITTVADFRRKDMALGGQGAPLVPAFHQTLFQSIDSSIVVLNIGGIANISVLRPNEPVIGYDTGVGNMLLDSWCQKITGNSFDKSATLAKQGKVNQQLLDSLLSESYLSLQPPKSTGRELFNPEWLETHLKTGHYSAPDIQRTLTEYTALTIANDVKKYTFGDKPELLVCGGGAHNPLIMQRLIELLPNWNVLTTEDKGVDIDNMEAMAFAWLAHRRINHLSSNLPEVTGAKKLASLGVIYPND